MKVETVSLLFIFVLGLVMANPSVDYRIQDNTVNVKIVLDSEYAEVRLPSDACDIRVGSEYSLVNEGVDLILFANGGTINYNSKSQIEKVSGGYFFVAKDNYLKNAKVSLYLPQGAVIDDEFFLFPKNYTVLTNGKNIIIVWENLNDDILISYKTIRDSNILLLILILILIILVAFLFFFQISKRKKRFSQNIFGDERRIIDFLFKQKGHVAWTKDIVHGLNISKVKLSRKLRNLEEKGLIHKIPHGNENRIFLKK